MENSTIYLQQLFLVVHLFAFAFAFVTLVKEDYRFITSKTINHAELMSISKVMFIALIILWLSGVGLIAINPGLDIYAILNNEKITSKLVIATILTINGLMLHIMVMPSFRRPVNHRGIAATLAAILGAISSVSWIFAAFIGSARIIAPVMSYRDYMLMYFICLIIAFFIGYFLIRPIADKIFVPFSDASKPEPQSPR